MSLFPFMPAPDAVAGVVAAAAAAVVACFVNPITIALHLCVCCAGSSSNNNNNTDGRGGSQMRPKPRNHNGLATRSPLLQPSSIETINLIIRALARYFYT